MTMKRLAAPKFWPIERKTKQYIVTPRPGPHPKNLSIPLAVVIRDILGYAHTIKEVKSALNKGNIKIDSKIKKDHAYPVGLMDIITIGEASYRVVPYYKGFNIIKIKQDESSNKLCRVRNKTCIGKKTQINLHDGKNLLVENAEGNTYKTGDVIVLDTKKNSIKQHLKIEKGMSAIIIAGHSIGKIGKIEEIIITKSSQPNQIVINVENRKIPIPKDYIFVIGKEKPVISLGEDK